MKKTLIALSAMAVALSFTACNEDDVITTGGDTPQAKTIIKAYTETTATRTALSGDDTNGYEVVWSTGDKFTLGGNEFALTDGDGTTLGAFEGTLPTTDGDYTAYYPTAYNGTDWPTTQTYTAGNITGSPMTAAATVTGGAVSGTLEFKNAGGILRLTVKGSAAVKSIKVAATELSDPITLDCGTGVTLTSTGVDFYIAMPTNTTGYTGVSIKLTDTDSKVCTKTLKPDYKLVINRSEITLASFTASQFYTLINGHEYVELAGYYWATENVYNATGATAKNVGNSSFGSYYVQSESKKAAASWGGTWTLPSEAQWQALLDGCDWTWKTNYTFAGTTMAGYLVTDKNDESKFIFLPAAGYYWEKPYTGSVLYWCSDELGNASHKTDHARELYGTSDGVKVMWGNELTGFPVRPVTNPPAPAGSTGTAKATIGGSEVDVPWVQLWENGPKFATYNVGVTDGKAESFGGYYCWGGTNNQYGKTELDKDSKDPASGNLSGQDDTATALWGSKWRMPTSEELGAYDDADRKVLCGGLLYECDCQWTENYNGTGVEGLICTGKGAYISNSIFLPAAGYYDDTMCFNSDASYLSSTAMSDEYCSALNFWFWDEEEEEGMYVGDNDDPTYPSSVRAVLNE